MDGSPMNRQGVYGWFFYELPINLWMVLLPMNHQQTYGWFSYESPIDLWMVLLCKANGPMDGSPTNRQCFYEPIENLLQRKVSILGPPSSQFLRVVPDNPPPPDNRHGKIRPDYGGGLSVGPSHSI
ncbi:hypothetical protein CDAR_30401 [Caerostris darwini]|uniref:Uncharacterized protein n=1 Tax=Caerostris darwini TaxID=1538125 RepID=A0AAV4VYH2_9ARAC|nr:hypothetical protein CDAR_30401 [Caerostris darwini]